MKPKFTTSEARYTVGGVYVFGSVSSSGKILTRQVFDWLAEGRYDVSTNAADEKLDMFSTQARKLVASFTSKMVCNSDPWRNAAAAPCQFVQTQPTGNPPGAFPSDLVIATKGIPFSADLSKTQRTEPIS